MKCIVIFLAAVFFTTSLSAQSKATRLPKNEHGLLYSVRSYGAKGNGHSVDTKAIQAAINDASFHGGGTVVFPAGKYLTGSIVLKDFIILRLEPGSIILGGTNMADYPAKLGAIRMNAETTFGGPLIYGENIQFAGIEGNGIIDGQGTRENFAPLPASNYRPGLIRFNGCNNLTITGVHLKNPARWTLHIRDCEDVKIHGVYINSRTNRNNDGIDVDGCSRVNITGCNINSEDDAIVLKSFRSQKCKDIVIGNCILSSFCSALKIGTETVGDFENISISNCSIYESRGINLFSVDGSDINNVTISNITIRDSYSAIQLRLGDRLRKYNATDSIKPKQVGQIRNIFISNVTAENVQSSQDFIAGIPGHDIENITLNNIKITYQGGGTVKQFEREIPENTSTYPKNDMFGDLPCYGFYVRHVNGIQLRNVQLNYLNKDLRPAIVCDQVRKVQILDSHIKGDELGKPCLYFNQSSNVLIKDNLTDNAMPYFVEINGRGSENILLSGNLVQYKKASTKINESVKNNTVKEFN